jgi:starch synthase (maltosyl-transferring)
MDPTFDTSTVAAVPRAYAVPLPDSKAEAAAAVKKAGSLGFDIILLLAAHPGDPGAETPPAALLGALAQAAHAQGLAAWAMLPLDRVTSDHPLAAMAFGPAPALRGDIVDPRKPVARGVGVVPLRRPLDATLQAWWLVRLERLRGLGFDGFAQLDPVASGLILAGALAGAGHAGIHSFVSLDAATAPDAPDVLIGRGSTPPDPGRRLDRLARAALAQGGWALEAGLEAGLEQAVSGVNSLKRAAASRPPAPLRRWTGAGAALSITTRTAPDGALLLAHNNGSIPTPWPPEALPPLPWQDFAPVPGFAANAAALAPGASILLTARMPPPAVPAPLITAAQAAEPAARVVISRLSPSVDAGKFAVKHVVGDSMAVEADIFADGHEQLAAAVLTRALGDATWARHPMRAQPNDVWTASVRFARLGRHEMVVEAWLDHWGGFTRDLAKKRDAGLDLALEVREGRALIERAAARAPAEAAAALAAALERLDRGEQEPATVLLAPALAAAMAKADDPLFLTRSFTQPIEVEREAARFTSWYELFPRSQTNDPERHGSFADVIARLPHVASMGFDTLYFPPIHPIGRKNRKGPNNTLTPEPHDVGSPYAIGSAEGGHDAFHPQLGTLADFRALVAAAAAHGLEIALDFAIQCAPDHPWLTEHPGWFAWRPDGSMKYAENPPKKYQDIVNVDFYGPDAVPALWEALRDVVLFWIGHGVRAFRVDNPHTKPLPFWQWMIGSVKAQHPEAIFLSEAFTRPKPMYHLAKVGFSQSYTYFTWRNDKAELTAYLTELTQTGVRDFFRPHFFVNTPDINPIFLQSSGRAGFLIRAALATTLSGLWGMYAGFELCESAPLPGREEYLDSEKYQIRPRPDRACGDIVDEITVLNRLRRSEPALQTHLGVSFHNAFNDRILYYSKSAEGHAGLILVAVSLDPHAAQEADFEVPLWLFGLHDGESVAVEDMLSADRFRWTGKIQRMRLTPDRPYAIWRIAPRAGA